jgi:hypothetical protein
MASVGLITSAVAVILVFRLVVNYFKSKRELKRFNEVYKDLVDKIEKIDLDKIK